MNEHNDSHEQHPPRWVPYTPPPPDGWDRLRILVRRLSFPVMALLFVAGVAGGLYWSLYEAPAGSVSPNVSVVPEGPRPQTDKGPAQLTVRSVPEGAAVRVNGDSIGTTPLAGRPLDAGVYMLSVRSEGYFRADTVVVLGAGTQPTFRMTLRPRPGTEVASARAEAPTRPAQKTVRPPSRKSSPPSPASKTPVAQAPSPRPERGQSPAAASPPPKSAPEASKVGALYVTSTPAGATVRVGDDERGRTPVAVPNLPSGPVRVQLSLEGHDDWSAEVSVQPDTTRQVSAALQARSGRLRVLAQPWGTIYVNGDLKVRESDIWYETTLPAGSYRVTAVHPALGQQVREVQVAPDDETSVVIDLQEAATSDATP